MSRGAAEDAESEGFSAQISAAPRDFFTRSDACVPRGAAACGHPLVNSDYNNNAAHTYCATTFLTVLGWRAMTRR